MIINLLVKPCLSLCHTNLKDITGNCQGRESDLCELPPNTTSKSTSQESTDAVSIGTYHELIKITLVR